MIYIRIKTIFVFALSYYTETTEEEGAKETAARPAEEAPTQDVSIEKQLLQEKPTTTSLNSPTEKGT